MISQKGLTFHRILKQIQINLFTVYFTLAHNSFWGKHHLRMIGGQWELLYIKCILEEIIRSNFKHKHLYIIKLLIQI
jgi:hypothetical protein